jgi:hypothetical protein
MFNNVALEQQADKLFPLSETSDTSAVLHARQKWIDAKQYLARNSINIKPLIGLRAKTLH